LSRGWKISGISQSKLDAFYRLQADAKFRDRVSSIRRICQQKDLIPTDLGPEIVVWLIS
jgi:hypothetical protein